MHVWIPEGQFTGCCAARCSGQISSKCLWHLLLSLYKEQLWEQWGNKLHVLQVQFDHHLSKGFIFVVVQAAFHDLEICFVSLVGIQVSTTEHTVHSNHSCNFGRNWVLDVVLRIAVSEPHLFLVQCHFTGNLVILSTKTTNWSKCAAKVKKYST